MISLTRLTGEPIALNHELIEYVEETPDTVLTCVNGTKHLVRESLDDVIERVRQDRALSLARSRQLAPDTPDQPGTRPHALHDADGPPDRHTVDPA